ncbi:MAG: T9SS type A sorting domain-containing protein, partial [candidate division KSB1 bacterium]|nr:T9SS type A sorting domain-containing protein [candidate division KSB1 bacterium]
SAGHYPGMVTISTNDTTMPVAQVPLSLTVHRKTEPIVVEDWRLEQNYPNPVNAATTVHYSVPSPGEVRIVVVNAMGQTVRTLVYDWHEVGNYRTTWDTRDEQGRSVGSGVYLYYLSTGGRRVLCRKLVVLR